MKTLIHISNNIRRNVMKRTLLFAAAMAILLTDSLVFAQDTTLTITSSGNVGIGTTTPGAGTNAKFDVVGRTSFRPISGNTNKALIFDDLGGALRIYTDALSGTPGDLILGTYPNGHTNQLVLQQSTGNVGIGTTAPDELLSVNGNASKVGGGTWATFSDRRLKQDIHTFTDGLSVVKAIHPVTFRYNGKLGYPTDKTYVGVIAQEILPVAPYTVDSHRAKLNPDDAEETDILRFDGTALIYIAINAIKELDAKVEELRELQKENRDLSDRLEELEALVKSLAAERKSNDGKSLGELR